MAQRKVNNLMKIIRVFPTRTSLTPSDGLSYSGKRNPKGGWFFHGTPPLDLPEADEVHISCSFTWDKPEAEMLYEAWGQYYPVVKIGGPAYGNITHNFKAGMYLKEGVTFTTRGCNNDCPWCLVREREGKLYEFSDFSAGNLIQDNNLLQASNTHLDKVFSMLKTQRAIEFTGGLDARLITDDVADRLRSIRIEQLFLASDTDGALRPLQKAIKKLHGISNNKIRAYVLIGFNNETMEHAEGRLIDVFNSGCLPYAMLYQPPTDKKVIWPYEWRNFARTWQRPAAMKAYMKYQEPKESKQFLEEMV
jgi:hypothetical protein